MDIKELNERIEQLTNLIKSNEEAIGQLNENIKLAEQERGKLADKRRKLEPKFERVEKGEMYFSITGELDIIRSMEGGYPVDDNKYNANNYFYTKKRTQEVADKIKFLMKLERFHDIYCHDYKAEDDGNDKYRIVFCDGMYQWEQDDYTIDFLSVYFPTEEIAQKVCNILNKENGIITEE